MEVKIDAYIHIWSKIFSPEILESIIEFPTDLDEDTQYHLEEDIMCHLSQLQEFKNLEEGTFYRCFGTAMLTYDSYYSEYYGSREYDSDLELNDGFQLIKITEMEARKKGFIDE